MFANTTAQTAATNLWAAAFSVGVSAILFAYAIVPASPNLIA